MQTTMRCESGLFTVPDGPGLGVEPAPEVWQHVIGA
jgi:galactonate dehydratase